jgi:Na+/phosphate symporter
MAIMLSYMLDTRLAMQGLRSLQWRETGISAVLMASTSWGIILLLEYSKTRYPMVHVPNALTMVLTATVIGAIIAFWLPTSTRRVAERAPERDEVARATPGTTDIHPTAT